MLCWEQRLSLKSYGDTRTQLVAGGTIQLSINWRSDPQRQFHRPYHSSLPKHQHVSLTESDIFKHHHFTLEELTLTC